MVKIIGIPSEQEAQALYDEWKKERDDWNRSAKRNNRIVTTCGLIACVILLTLVAWHAKFDFNNFTVLHIFLTVAIPVFGGLSILFGSKCEWEYNEYSLPAQYKYYDVTKDKTVLESAIKKTLFV